MADILFNKAGVPLMAYGSKGAIINTTGVPSLPKTAQPQDPLRARTIIDDFEIADWGTGNSFPTKTDEIVNKVGVLNSGLKFIRNFTIGQGIFPVIVKGYDDAGNEILERVNDPAITNFAKSRMVRRYMEKAVRDYMKFGCAFVQMIPNVDGSKLVGLNTINAKYARLNIANSLGTITKCVTSGKWPDNPMKDEYSVFDVLDDYDPLADLDRRRFGKSIKGKSFIYCVKDSWSNNEYYSGPVWYTGYLSGWVDIALSVPRFLKKAYENQITWKWHVQIPYAFWDKKFPASDFKTTELRKEAISKYMDDIEANLCGPENANKPIFTMFEINPNNGKTEEQWIIEPLNNKLDNQQNLVTSAAANSEILFSLMLNPNVLGAGMPGGTYAGNQGGSNIREAFLVNIANAWLDRQNLLDPLETFTRFNGADENIEWRFRNTILTTLDTGSGTQKTLS